MAFKRLAVGLAFGLCASSAAAGFDGESQETAFDVKAIVDQARAIGGQRSSAKAEEVWITLNPEDLFGGQASGIPLEGAMVASDSAGLFRLPLDRLPVLSEFMHRRFRRCGGFFGFATREQASESLSAAATTAAPIAYTIDQPQAVKPLMARVEEKRLRATIETLAAYHNRYYLADTGRDAAHWIHDRWGELAAPLPGASTRLVRSAQWTQPSVILTIPGADLPDEVVVLGGHLDSIGSAWWSKDKARAPGADDNASGIAVLTEAIRLLAESGFRPKRTIEFMGYSAEEVGLWGSQAIAQSYKKQGRKVVGVIQFDMTNFKGSAKDVYLLSDYVNADLTAFLGRLLDAYVGVAWSTTKCGYACSDHASWTKSGFPASAAFESSLSDMNDDIHTERDTLGNSGGTAAHSVAFAKLAVAFAVEMAKTPAALAARR